MISRFETKSCYSIVPGQESSGELNILGHALLEVVAAVGGIGRGQDAHSRVQRRHDPGLGNGDGLLFHDFMDGGSVLVGHLIELVDAADPLVGQDKSPALQHHLARQIVFHDGGSQTGAGRTAAGRVLGPKNSLEEKLAREIRVLSELNSTIESSST